MVKVASLFSGIGGFERGFLMADPNTEFVFASENDKIAKQIYTKNYGGEYLHGDITKINAADVPDHDILCFGFPCQDVSIAGKRAGLCGERSGLFFEGVRILREKQPELILIENVEGLLSSNRGWDFARVLIELEDAGYICEWQVLNSKAFIPQNRERVFIVGHLGGYGGRKIFPVSPNVSQADVIQKQNTNCITARYGHAQTTGSYIIENKFDEKGIRKIARCLTGGGHSGGMHSDMTVVPCHSTLPRSSKSGKGGVGPLHRNDGISYCISAVNNVAIETDLQIRRLTPLECERLQGFPDHWTAEGINNKGNIVKISDTQRYKCIGNAVTVPVVEFLATRILSTF